MICVFPRQLYLLQDHDAIFYLAVIPVLRGHVAGVVETSRYDEVDVGGF